MTPPTDHPQQTRDAPVGCATFVLVEPLILVGLMEELRAGGSAPLPEPPAPPFLILAAGAQPSLRIAPS
jgi:hypothetical protein